MKKLFFVLIACVAICSCDKKDDGIVNPSPDPVPEVLKTLNFEGEYFTKLIDNPQYGGPLLYSEDKYEWTDTTSLLTSGCQKDDWTMYGMGWGWKDGIAISSYVDGDEKVDYLRQLAVPVSNGSRNFAVAYKSGTLSFSDGKARVIQTMDICSTTYLLNNMKASCGKGYRFYLVLVATHADYSTKSQTVTLAEDEKLVETWQTIDLSALGEVKKIDFVFTGTDNSDWGLNTPAYFAFDNVVVKF
ncbi:MAG: DUF4465 domain-containing protein [Bacteroidaceae bacterium]|nr:DUF4465 domain-containing protein [Bacteroidaceae bacterium]